MEPARPWNFFKKNGRMVATMIKEIRRVIPSINDGDQNTEKEVDIPSGSGKKNDVLVVEIRKMVGRPEINTEKEVDIPSGSGKKNDELVVEIRKMVGRPEIESSTQCLIYKVPTLVRKWNEEAYVPQVVSIGPLHHKNERVKAMEEHKERYLRSFLQWSVIKLEDLVGVIRDSEESIRGCYEETIDLTSDRFVKMILLDAIFILELFIRDACQVCDDPNISDPRASAIVIDLLLLENQLPFFLVEKLYDLASPNLPKFEGFLDLCFNYFCHFNLLKIEPSRGLKMEHFTDLIRTFQLPPPERQRNRSLPLIKHMYSATQLHEAGVKFEVGESNRYFDIKYEKGVLKIPRFQIESWTEIVARNIMALEQTRYIENAHYTDYFIFLDHLINTTEDVDLLCDREILVNIPGDSDGVKSMINNLQNSVLSIGVGKDYSDLCKELNGFYEDPWHKWKATFKRDYFSTPWKIASTVAAIILLVLTFIQTILSIIQVIEAI